MNTPVPTTAGAVFLSYASQDAEAARRICAALRAAGVEVWFDQNELVGGDQWDAKIKRQIRECALFVPIVSANTQARTEGYFRREWNLAAQRLLDMAPGRPFLLPIAIDDTREQDAFVAEEFLKVQWMRLPDGEASAAQIARVRALLQTLAQGTTHPLPRPAAPADPARPVAWSRRPRRWFVAAALLVAAIAVAIYQARGPAPRLTKQLAILPFTTIGEALANQAFSEGLSETISSQLTQLEQFQRKLLVVPMSEVRKEAVVTPSQARAMFGATLVLTGSVQRAEALVRVTVSLVDAVSLRIVRSGTFDNPPTELYRLQDRIAAQTAEWLGLDLSPEAKRALTAGQTNVASAYDLYVQGRGELARRDSSGNVDAAIVRLQQATMADPQYALAYAALGEAFWRKYLETKDRQWIADAQKSCRAAMQYGATLPTPHITLATLLIGLGEYEQGVAEAEAALRLDSTSADATRALARAYDRLNRPAEAEAAFKRAIARSPDNSQAHTELGVFYWRAGRLTDAENSFRRVIALTPESYSAYRNLGGLLVMVGRTEPAAEILEKSLALKPTAGAYSNLGTLRFQQGRYAEAATLYDRAVSLSPKDHVLLGNLGDALRNVPGRNKEAAEAYARAISLADAALAVNPKDAGVRAVLARYHAMTGNNERAIAEIEQARALASNNVPMMFTAALVYEKTGDRRRAVESLESALRGGYSRTDVIQEPTLKELRREPNIASLLSEPPRQSK